MRRIQAGDTHAFAVFYDRHAAAVYRCALRVVRRESLAEDVTQDAFVGFWRARAGYTSARGSAVGWLLSIARNRAVDVVRRGAYREQLVFEHADRESPESTEREVFGRADRGAVARAMQTLPVSQREVVELSFTGGFSQAEIAERLSVPLGTVKGRTRLAFDKLRPALAEFAPARAL